MADPSFHHKTSPQTLNDLAALVDAQVQGDGDMIIDDVAALDTAQSNEISFLDNIKYKDAFTKTKAGAVIVAPKMVEFAPSNTTLIISNNPYKMYALIAQSFYPVKTPPAKIDDAAQVQNSANIAEGCVIEAGAVIGCNVTLAENCWVEANAVIGDNVRIGAGTRIGANASITHAIIGQGSRIYPGARIGQDGFGFAIDPAGHVKVPQLGRVIIGDHVEIGANSCIDRGASSDTIIGDGTWIDNLVQIGHNVQTGKGCVIVAQAGVAGSTTLEDYVVLAAQSGVVGHLTIGTGTRIAGQSGVMHNLPPGSEVMGYPALPIKQFMRQVATLKKLTKPKKS
jgi:UDP-3-O-[3-hydroxymyristoyl] glucosamine N-acyltransferase